MSLINDALKKAQKQRTGDTPELNQLPSIGGESAVRIARRDKPPGFNSLLLWIGAGATSLLVVLVGGFFVVRWMMNRPETPAAVKPAVVAQSTPAATQPAPSAVVPAVSTGAKSVSSSATSTPVPVVETKPVAVEPVAPPPQAEPPKPAAPPPKMDSKAVAYIDTLRVAGIRASSTDSKVLMNDRVYRIGDLVEHQLGLKLAVIAPSALTFEDENGARYTRNF